MERAGRHADSGSLGDSPTARGAPGKRTLTGSLPAPVQRQMERSFGVDLSPVQIHQDGAAEAMGAEAFAQGTDIHMAAGRYDPSSTSGLELIGHEIAHVVQQSEGRVSAARQFRGAAINDDPVLEAEADAQGARAARGESARGGGSPDLGALPALQTVVHAPRQGYFKHNGSKLDAGTQKTIRDHLVKIGSPLVGEFDTKAGSPSPQGTLAAWLKKKLGVSVSSIVSGAMDQSDDEEESDEEESGDDEAKGNGARIDGGYESDNVPDAGDALGSQLMWQNKKKGQEVELDEHEIGDVGLKLAQSIRTFRDFDGRVPADEAKNHPPMLARFGSQYFHFAPTPARKDAAVAPLRRSASGEHLERAGRLKTYAALAKALDGFIKKGLSAAKLKANLKHLRDVDKDAKHDLPYKVPDECLHLLREMAAILIVDEARASQAFAAIDEQVFGAESFTATFGGSSPSYIGAPRGGSQALQADTAARKEADGDADMSGDESA